MAVDYLKTYLGIDPNDYSAMEARIRGEEPQAQSPLMMRQPMMMPQQRSLGDIEAMQMMPRQQPAPQPAPQVDDRYQGLMDQIAALRSQIEGMQAPTEQAPVGAEAPVMADEPSMMDEQDVFSSWRNSPEKAAYDAKGFGQTMDYRPKNYTDPVTGQVFKLDDRSGTFADYYKKTYGRDLAVEDNSFRGSLGSGLGGILDEKIQSISNSIQAPVGIENRAVGEPQPMPYIDPYKQGDNYVTDDAIYNPTGGRNVFEEAKAPAEDIQASIDYLAKLPKMNIPQIPDMEEIRRKMAEANMNFPEPVSYQDQLQSIRDIPQPNLQNNFMGNSARNVMSQIQQPQMQSVGRPSMPMSGGFRPEFRAGGGGIDKAIYDLKFKLNG
jgi:hypothetical protein